MWTGSRSNWGSCFLVFLSFATLCQQFLLRVCIASHCSLKHPTYCSSSCCFVVWAFLGHTLSGKFSSVRSVRSCQLPKQKINVKETSDMRAEVGGRHVHDAFDMGFHSCEIILPLLLGWDLFSLGSVRKSWGNSASLMGVVGNQPLSNEFGNLPEGRPGDWRLFPSSLRLLELMRCSYLGKTHQLSFSQCRHGMSVPVLGWRDNLWGQEGNSASFL